MSKDQKHNIAVFSSSWLGRSETFIYRQLMGLEDHGFKSILLTQELKESDLKKKYRGKVYYKKMDLFHFYFGVADRKLRLRKNGYAASIFQKRFWKKALRDNNIALIHAHYGPAGLRILDLAKETGTPLITTFHGNDASAMLKKKVYRDGLRVLFEYSYIISVSEFLRERLIDLGAPEEKVICHYIGTDVNKFNYSEHKSICEKVKKREKITFLQVSNFVEKKGHKYTIQAFKLYLKEYPNSELILAGDGPTKLEMIEQVRTLNLEEKVQFLGPVTSETVSELMKSSDVFVHHSITGSDGAEEGIPTVLMEAMASGIPVVSTLHAGIPELITNQCGFLVEEKNTTEYAKTLISLLNYSTGSMVMNAKERVHKHFDVKKQNRALIELYSKIIKDKKYS